jgi:alpha-1,3-mannosyltransferase
MKNEKWLTGIPQSVHVVNGVCSIDYCSFAVLTHRDKPDPSTRSKSSYDTVLLLYAMYGWDRTLRRSGVTPARLKAFAVARARYLALLVFIAVGVTVWIRGTRQLNPMSSVSAGEQPADEVAVSLAADLDYLNTALHEHFASHGATVPRPVFPRAVLTPSQRKRYRHLAEHLRANSAKVMFTTIIRQIQDQLPDLLTALVVLVDFLGPTSLTFSFIEGPSSDLTSSTFESVLHPLLIAFGVPARQIRMITNAPRIDFDKGNRIELLANLRNQALSPLWEDRERKSGGIGEGVEQVVFFNDVYMKAEHVLELLHQHSLNGADVTTAWDWFRRVPRYYYDVWVGRTVRTLLRAVVVS